MNSKISSDSKIFNDYLSKTAKSQSSEQLECVSTVMKAIAEDYEHPGAQVNLHDGKVVRISNLTQKDIAIFEKFAKYVIKSNQIEEPQGEELLKNIKDIEKHEFQKSRLSPKLEKLERLASMKYHILLQEKISLPQEEGNDAIKQVKRTIVNEICQEQSNVKSFDKKSRRDFKKFMFAITATPIGVAACLGGGVALAILGGPIGLGIGLGIIAVIGIAAVILKIYSDVNRDDEPTGYPISDLDRLKDIETLKLLKNEIGKPEFQNAFAALKPNKQNEIANQISSIQEFISLYKSKEELKAIQKEIDGLNNDLKEIQKKIDESKELKMNAKLLLDIADTLEWRQLRLDQLSEYIKELNKKFELE